MPADKEALTVYCKQGVLILDVGSVLTPPPVDPETQSAAEAVVDLSAGVVDANCAHVCAGEACEAKRKGVEAVKDKIRAAQEQLIRLQNAPLN